MAGGVQAGRDGYFVAIDPVPALRLAEHLQALPAGDVCFTISGFHIEGLLPEFSATGLCHALVELPRDADVPTIMSYLQPRKRTQMRQALRQKYEVQWRTGEAVNARELYAFYRENMARHGTIPRSQEDILVRLRGSVDVVTISFEGSGWAAANVIETAKPYALVRFSLSDPQYWPRHVNEVLYFESVRGLMSRGFRLIDLGPTGVKDEALRRFKRHLGGREYAIYVYRRTSRAVMLAERWGLIWHRVRTLKFRMREHGTVRTLREVVRGAGGRLRRRRA